MESKVVGQLNPVEYDQDYFESAPYPFRYFNNKELKVGFIESRHPPYLKEADHVLQNFLKLRQEDRIKDSQMVYKYYEETLKYGYTKPLNIKSIQDIWDFVCPGEIIIHWDENDNYSLGVSCGCEWEEEHGLELIFEHGLKLIKASGHE